jgi:uncharacterized protein (TIGR03792 family)
VEKEFMVVEWLIFEVAEEEQERFITQDAAIWSKALAAQPGYLRKEIWRERAAPNKLNLAIYWRSRADWHAVPQQVLGRADAKFAKAMGRPCPVLACIDYDIIA